MTLIKINKFGNTSEPEFLNLNTCPYLPDEIWYNIINFLIDELSEENSHENIKAVLYFSLTCQRMYSIISDECLWKKIALKFNYFLPSIKPISFSEKQEKIIREKDSWKKLAIRLLPIKNIKKEKLITKTTVLKFFHVPEKLLWGNLSFKMKKNPYGSSYPMILFRKSSIKEIIQLAPEEIAKKKKRSILMTRLYNKKIERRGEIIKKRKEIVSNMKLKQIPFIQTKLELYIYTENTNLLEILQCKDRYLSLEKSLKNNNLYVRRDSSMCKNYILYGNESIDTVTNVMIEMNFLYNRTNYPSINNDLLNSDTYYWNSGDLDEDYLYISEQAKKIVYKSLRKKDIKYAPEYVKQRFYFFKAQD